MNFVMAYYPVTLVVILIAHATIFPVNGQCTVQGCDNGDPLISIFAEIQQLRVDLFDQLRKQVQSNNELFSASFQELTNRLDTLNISCQDVDRCPLERDIFREQFQSMHEIFNESLREMKNQHDAIVTSLHAVDRCLEVHDISIRNQTQNSVEEHEICIRNQTQNSRTFANGTGNCDPASDVCDCSDIKESGQNTSGVYEVCVGHQLSRTCSSTFCDMESANRASLVFQRRKDGSVNFNRTWAEYREGFGNPDGEFWLGNEMLHLLTSKREYKLRVDLEDWEGAKRYAEYATFSISSSANKYRLTVGNYSGNAGYGMDYHNGEKFTTNDADNDNYGGNCALTYGGGGWWYHYSFHANLNGIYRQRHETSSDYKGIHWLSFRGYVSLKATEMKLVPVA